MSKKQKHFCLFFKQQDIQRMSLRQMYYINSVLDGNKLQPLAPQTLKQLDILLISAVKNRQKPTTTFQIGASTFATFKNRIMIQHFIC